MKHLIAMLALQQTAAVVLKRAAATTPQAFERATGLRVLHMSPAVVVVDKPTGLRSVPAYGPTRALLADFARRQAAGEENLQAKFERPTRRDRWCGVARDLDG
jgi:23S rRNA-/tRNA-specific pseudouridylate synthase